MVERAEPNGQDFQVSDPPPVPQESEEQPMMFEKNREISFDMRGSIRHFAGAQAYLIWLILGKNTVIPAGTTDDQLGAYYYPEGQAASEIYGEDTINTRKQVNSTKGNVNSRLSVSTVRLRIDARFVPSLNDPNKKERELYLHAISPAGRASPGQSEGPIETDFSPGESPVDDGAALQDKSVDKQPINGSGKKAEKDVTSAFEGQRPMSSYDLSISEFIEQIRQSMTKEGAPLSKLEKLIAEQGITTPLSRLHAVRKWTRILQQADIVVFDDRKGEDIDESSEHTDK